MRSVCMGGTFDVIHLGHRVLLEKALDIADFVIIGLTTDKRARQGREKIDINPYLQRELHLQNWLKENGFSNRVEIVPLDDNWGPAAVESKIEGIVVSKEKEDIAHKLNRFRNEKSIPEIEVIVVPMVKAYDGNRISSSRIRKKEIDLDGFKT